MINDVAWEQVDLSVAELDLPVAIGGSLSPHHLLEAYRHGVFPLPCTGAYLVEVNRTLYGDYVAEGRIKVLPHPGNAEPYAVTWWCPPRRPVIPANAVHLSQNLKRDLRNKYRWITTCDQAFAEVVEQCRDLRRTQWITDELRDSLVALHQAGWANSIEVWHDDVLIGGLFGTGMGGIFSADSTFSRRRDAGKVAFADLGRRLCGRAATLIDIQVPSAFTTDMGAEPISRKEYLDVLRETDLPLTPETGVLPVGPLGGQRK